MPETENMELKNFMEVIVREMLPAVLANSPVCTCERCRLDILSYALNNLPPRYVVTNKGDMFARLETMQVQFEADVATALINGAKLVGSNPRHV